MDAATAIFRHGPDFVGADTVKNPLPAPSRRWRIPPFDYVAERRCRSSTTSVTDFCSA
jgi:hypothetical protein